MSRSRSTLFLRGRSSAYYPGLDPRAFPFPEDARRRGLTLRAHLLYVKSLTLLVEHVSVPPSFLVHAMLPGDKRERMLRSTVEFLQSGLVVSAVPTAFQGPEEYVEHKALEGDEDERAVFAARLPESTRLFSEIPHVSRSNPAMSTTFRGELANRLQRIPAGTLPPQHLAVLIARMDHLEEAHGVALSRKGFIALCRDLKLSRRAFRASHYAMNACYYQTGALSYQSRIACPHAEDYARLGLDFFGVDEGRAVIGYDPALFLAVLACHGVSARRVESLHPSEIMQIRSEPAFQRFAAGYFRFVALRQAALASARHWGRPAVEEFKNRLMTSLQGRLGRERRTWRRLARDLDMGAGFLLGGVAAFVGVVPFGVVGALAGASLGLLGPVLKATGLRGADAIIARVGARELQFERYLRLLEEHVAEAGIRRA